MGTVDGTVTVTGAPKKFTPAYLGAGACPTLSPPNQACSDPHYSLAGPDGRYTLSLSPGTWRRVRLLREWTRTAARSSEPRIPSP